MQLALRSEQRGGLKVRGHDAGGPARPATEVQARTTTARPGALRGRAQLRCGESVCPKNLLGLEADEHAEEEPRRTAQRLMQPVSRGPASWPPPSSKTEPAPSARARWFWSPRTRSEAASETANVDHVRHPRRDAADVATNPERVAMTSWRG